MQGAAFDVPQEIADQMMENVEELTKRGFTLDMPTSLPVEEERSYGGDRRFGMRPGGGSRGGCATHSPFALLQGTCNLPVHPDPRTLILLWLPRHVSSL